MGRRGRTGESGWIRDFLWDMAGCCMIGLVLMGICVSALWVAGQIFLGVIDQW